MSKQTISELVVFVDVLWHWLAHGEPGAVLRPRTAGPKPMKVMIVETHIVRSIDLESKKLSITDEMDEGTRCSLFSTTTAKDSQTSWRQLAKVVKIVDRKMQTKKKSG